MTIKTGIHYRTVANGAVTVKKGTGSIRYQNNLSPTISLRFRIPEGYSWGRAGKNVAASIANTGKAMLVMSCRCWTIITSSM